MSERTTIVRPEDAVALVRDGDRVVVGGSGSLLQVPETLLRCLGERFALDGHPNDLDVVHVMGLGDRDKRGISHIAREGLVRRFIASHYILSPAQQELIAAEKVQAYALPAGSISLLFREIAAGRPGLFTDVGLGTYVDPRHEGGRLNESTTGALGRLVRIDDRDWIHYPSMSLDVALLRASTADEDGNLSMEDEGGLSDNLGIAMAVRRSGGLVVAEVKRVVARGTLPAQQVRVPATLVDHVVLTDHPWQTPLTRDDPFRSGRLRAPGVHLEPLPLDHRKVVGRRAARLLEPGAVVNIGVGMSNVVSYVAAEEGRLDDVTMTVEQGIFGGISGVDLDSGTALNPDALIDMTAMFDFYDGGGLDICFLGMGETDARGNVNVSRLGGRAVGPGGFVDISQNTGCVVFCGTFTGGGLRTRVDGGALSVEVEGRYPKFVEQVEQVTFSGERAANTGQQVWYVTERAVFRLGDSGLELVEIAPGVDLHRDVLDRMDFRPFVSPDLREMDPTIFSSWPGIDGSSREHR